MRCNNHVFLPFCLLLVLCALSFVSDPIAQAQTGRPVLITQSLDEAKLVALGGNTRPEANPKYDRGVVPDSFRMEHMMLQLKRSPEQERELRELIDELTDSSSPNFHHWLTAREFGERFGLSEQDLRTVTRWLESHGFNVNVVYENGVLIDFSGTADQVRAAFHTEIHNLDVEGVKHYANIGNPKIPAALAPAVVGIVSLHDFFPHSMYEPKANFTFSSKGDQYYAVVPADLATIYNLNPLFTAGITGQGQTIALIEDSDIYSADDWSTFRSTFGLSSYSGGSFKQIHPSPASGSSNCKDPGATRDDTEATLDAEYASAAAPGAAIVLASCDNTATFGGMIALQNVVNQSTPPSLVSYSYGECETLNGATANAAYNAAYQQAVTEGISVFVSAGDYGASTCAYYLNFATNGIGVNALASTPYNVAVGGTDFGDTYAGTGSTYWSATNSSTYGSALSYIPEIPWNDSCASLLAAEFNGFSQTYGTSGYCFSGIGEYFWTITAAGGGPSGCATGAPFQGAIVGGTCAGYAKPSWQSLVGNPGDTVRDLPDVSLFAANGVWWHYYPYCLSDPRYGYTCTGTPDTWIGAGGTSFASPIMAGIQALIDQKTGERQGNPNPTYYKLAATEYGKKGNSSCNSTLGNAIGKSCIFYDVTLGDMDTPCSNTTVDCYDTTGQFPNGLIGVLSTSDTAYEPTGGTINGSVDGGAYPSTTGWDFATGIGTVNATNLANNWPSSTSGSFTLSTSPTAVNVEEGSKGTVTITIAPANGFNGSVKLVASGLPNGVTASLNPNPSSSSSTLTFTASTTATLGTSSVTITGTSGTLSATTTIKLTITNGSQGNFTLTAKPATLKIAGGGSGTVTVTIMPNHGFDGTVTLKASGLPSGVKALFSPVKATSTSTLKLKVSESAPVGASTITITGTAGGLSHTVKVKLTVSK